MDCALPAFLLLLPAAVAVVQTTGLTPFLSLAAKTTRLRPSKKGASAGALANLAKDLTPDTAKSSLPSVCSSGTASANLCFSRSLWKPAPAKLRPSGAFLSKLLSNPQQ